MLSAPCLAWVVVGCFLFGAWLGAAAGNGKGVRIVKGSKGAKGSMVTRCYWVCIRVIRVWLEDLARRQLVRHRHL